MALILTRRQSLAVLAASVIPRRAAGVFRHFPEDGAWTFLAEVDGKRVGEHRIVFQRDGGSSLIVRSDSAWTIDRVYEQHVEERWIDGWLRSLVSDTRYGTERWHVRTEWMDGALRGHRNGHPFSIAGYSIPFTLWHPESPHVRELLDPRDAKLKIIDSFDIGRREVLVGGQLHSGQGHGLFGSIEAALWYDDDGALLAATVPLPDGTSVDLRLSRVTETRAG